MILTASTQDQADAFDTLYSPNLVEGVFSEVRLETV
jgi:hypothetical protein